MSFFLMIRRPPRSTRKESSAASDVYKRQDLTLHVAFRLAQVTQAAGLVVNVEQLDQLVDEAHAQLASFLRTKIEFGRDVRAQDNAVDPLHDVELGANHALIGAVHIGFGAVGKTVIELIENTELATHIVGRLGLVPIWRAAQYKLFVRVFKQIGQVRGAARKLTDARRAGQTGNMCLEVAVYGGRIKF